MRFPYQCLHVSGDVLIAAQGASIHSFNLKDGSLVDSWTHPTFKPNSTNPPVLEDAGVEPPTLESLEPAASGTPLAKRRKLVTEAESECVNDNEEGDDKLELNGSHEAKKERSRETRKHNLAPQPKSPEIPLVICLTGSSRGGHIVAVTSTDKTIWVFEHDGQGHLKQLKQRPMPKRPSAIAITADEKTIVSGDKFGDVYALPLIPSDAPPAPPAIGGAPTPPPPSKPRGPEANELTVHSQRNLKALIDQRRTLEEKLRKQSLNPGQEQPAEAGDHTLLLGHVSMLTALVLASSPSTVGKKPRDYLITADRDEHIRVSRGIPQAHVIENFCFGHESFVSRLCLLPGLDACGRSILVSGGGDGALFVWDWQAGRLLHKVPIFAFMGEAKLAVSGIFAARCRGFGDGDGDGTQVFVLCERLPMILVLRLMDNAYLENLQRVNLPGHPLDMAVVGRQGGGARFVVSIMPPQGKSEIPGLPAPSGSLLGLERGAEGWCYTEAQIDTGAQAAEEVDLPGDGVEKLLFNVESLRKMDMEDAAGVSVVE